LGEKRQIRAVKGVRDILPPETALWNRVEQVAHEVFATYGYGEIRLPIFEQTELFARSIGQDTDVVSKEMYTFQDPLDLEEIVRVLFEKGIDPTKIHFETAQQPIWDLYTQFEWLTLRPEATASVCRAYIEHGMHTWPGNVKLYYLGPMFRRERPQKGRYRQFYQIGAEVLGKSDAPAIDAEVIEMLMAFFERVGLKGATLYLNSIGCKDCRAKYVELLREELRKVKDKLGADSQRRIETNPLRVLDSKLPEEQAVIEKLPRIGNHLCAACREHFAEVQRQLKLRGIGYEINWRLVRGLDYYMRTTFEITAPGLGAQNAVCGGGRYDGLVELLGGPPTKGIGFAIGEDRLVLSLQEMGPGGAATASRQDVTVYASSTAIKAEIGNVKVGGGVEVFIAWMGATAYPMALKLARRLREEGYAVELPAEDMKLKKSLGLADKLGARYAVIIGEDEITKGIYTLKGLAGGEQKQLREEELIQELKAQKQR